DYQKERRSIINECSDYDSQTVHRYLIICLYFCLGDRLDTINLNQVDSLPELPEQLHLNLQ
ncbi:MAG TPA: hypothetical protein DF296_00855, partial [Candidatus Margulisbacteria bacterium]|nr:hypothetical protein [Candidatus Margulisiibacteriota bacterium]